MPEELQAIFQVIQGGAEVAAENVTELIADNGAKIADITTHTAFGGNGAATEVAEVVNISEGAASGTTGGIAVLTTEVGAAGAAIAPALGILAGVGLYQIAPDIWDNIAADLMEAGELVGGKVVSWMDSQGNTSYSQNTIEIFKNAFLNAGLFDIGITYPASESQEPLHYTYTPPIISFDSSLITGTQTDGGSDGYVLKSNRDVDCMIVQMLEGTSGCFVMVSRSPFKYGTKWGSIRDLPLANTDAAQTTTRNGTPCYIAFIGVGREVSYPSGPTVIANNSFPALENTPTDVATMILDGLQSSDVTQPGAVTPTEVPFPQTYPNWQPWDLPIEIPGLPELYPISLPTPEIVQPGSQTGTNTDPLQIGDLIDLIYNPAINEDPLPSPQPDPDVDPEISPESPDVDPIEPSPDPIDPTPTPPVIAPVIPIPTPDTTSANAMFTVYNPTDAQVNALGGFLWTDSIIEQIKKMWEDPMQAIISFHKVYCTPVTGGSSNIILGYVDSGVSSLVVTNQFVTVNCGNVTVEEWLHNATDYNPFTKAMIYLPFIGIVDLDITDIMNSTVNVTYKIDVYTGTCIAMISCQRSPDMTTPQILYTFSGNASQQLPLTGSSFSGAVGALLGLAGAGIAVASGGAGLAVGAVGAAHSLTQEMVHMQRSGGLSANAGIMAPRYPYIILERQNSADANAYASYYGFPANKTVNLQNCSGYIRVKAINLKSNATNEEKDMIIQQLMDGVII